MAGNVKAQALRHLLARGEFILAPGIYDGISARVADGMGFPALYMTGYGTVASHMGLPDAGLATYSDMVGRVTAMAGMAKTPSAATITRSASPISSAIAPADGSPVCGPRSTAASSSATSTTDRPADRSADARPAPRTPPPITAADRSGRGAAVTCAGRGAARSAKKIWRSAAA